MLFIWFLNRLHLGILVALKDKIVGQGRKENILFHGVGINY